MAQGQRRSRLSENCGRDYFKKRGLFERCVGWWWPVSMRAGVNKKTKRFSNKSERQQVRKHIKNVMENNDD